MHRLPLLFAACLLALPACRPVPRAAGPLPHDIYVWQRAWTPAVRTALTETREAMHSFVPLAAEISMTAGAAKTTRPALDYAALRGTGRPIGLAIRIGPFGASPPRSRSRSGAPPAPRRGRALRPRAPRAAARAARRAGSSFVYGPAAGYRLWLRELRAAVAPLPVCPTVLPSWLKRAEFAGLARDCGRFVLQVHSVAPPRELAGLGKLTDPVPAAAWVEQAAQLGVPFRVALPTYAYLVAFDAEGKAHGLSAEGPASRWPEGLRVVRWEADPADLAGLIARWQRDRPAALTGVIMEVSATSLCRSGSRPTGAARGCSAPMRWKATRSAPPRPAGSVSSGARRRRFRACRRVRSALSGGFVVSPRSPFKSLWLLLLLAPLPLLATGFDEPARWLVDYDRPTALQPPEFYFELEVKRIAAEQPYARRTPAPKPRLTGAKQLALADERDFADALATKRIAPPDPAAATEANQRMRAFIDSAVKPEDPGPLVPEPPNKEFASEFADYHQAARVYRRGDASEAPPLWQKLLARPEAERHYRTTWCLYMLGQDALGDEKWEEARGWFIKTRAAVSAGFADTLDLYTASLGWEAYACLKLERYPEAARLYLEQLAGGDLSAVNSLHVVLDEVFKEEADLGPLAADPALQRLGTAGAVSGMSAFQVFGDEESRAQTLPMRWLAALEKVNARRVHDADRLAWIAYAGGDFKTALRWLARADAENPYTLWLRAKFALRDGKLNDAATLLARAVEKVPPSPPLVSRNLGGSEVPPDGALKGDLGLVRLGRGEFLQAFSVLRDAGQLKDAEYLADSVLTIDELKTIVTRDYPEKPKPPEGPSSPFPSPKVEEADESEDAGSNWPTQSEDPTNDFRGILASRLIRGGRLKEARPYLPEEARSFLDEYSGHLDTAKKPGLSKADRSAALWAAAQIMNEHGNVLADYYDPVTAAKRLHGRAVDTEDSSVIAIKYGQPLKFTPAITKAELDRLRANSKPELRRYYSTYLAADLGWQAAALLPDNEEATAKMLNTAGSWLKIGDEKAADRFYQAIERRCAKTTLGQAAIKRHWFVPDE